jgi:copper transporter 1
MNHSAHGMGHTTTIDHSSMDHSSMDHSSMDHSSMDHSTMDHSKMVHGMMDHDMKMFFHARYSEYVLFESCLTSSPGEMVGACVVIFALAVLYEGLKFIREVVLQRTVGRKGQSTYTLDKLPAASSQEQMVMETKKPTATTRMLTGNHFIQTFLHVVQVFISYCLMLVFMTYNVWLCLAVILGVGVGYFAFGWKRAMVVDTDEHCH